MIASKLTHSPIHGHLDLRHFHPSASHEEALARLHYLAEQHLRLGVLLGAAGSGKTLLLAKLAQQLESPHRHIVQVSLLGKDPLETLVEIARELQIEPTASAVTATLWRAISVRLQEHRLMQHETVMLLDDGDVADLETLTVLCRLSELDPAEEARLTMVVTASSEAATRLPCRMLQRAALRIDIEPWEQTDTLDFLTYAVEQLRNDHSNEVTLPDEVFSADAAAKLHELAGGLPRRVGQLAQWSLLAGAGMGLGQVDEETVISAAEELGLPQST